MGDRNMEWIKDKVDFMGAQKGCDLSQTGWYRRHSGIDGNIFLWRKYQKLIIDFTTLSVYDCSNYEEEFITMPLNCLQHILTRKLRYCPGGVTLCRRMSSLFDAAFNWADRILGTEDHMFWPIRSVCVS
jgi:hypothetical protein